MVKYLLKIKAKMDNILIKTNLPVFHPSTIPCLRQAFKPQKNILYFYKVVEIPKRLILLVLGRQKTCTISWGRFFVDVFVKTSEVWFNNEKSFYNPNSDKSDPRYSRSFSPRIPRDRHIMVHKCVVWYFPP